MEIKWFQLFHAWRYLDGYYDGPSGQTCISNSVTYLEKTAEQRLGVSLVWTENKYRIESKVEVGEKEHHFWIQEMDAGEVVYIAEGEPDGK